MRLADPFVFAHASDLHLTDPAGVDVAGLAGKRLLGYLSWRRHRRREHDRRVLEALQQDLQALDPGHVVVTGDLTHLGLPDEFRQARRWLDSLQCRSLSVVPGNHDSYVRELWSATYRQWLPYLAPDAGDAAVAAEEEIFPTLVVRGEVAFIGLSSALPTAPFLASGTLGSRQRQKLAGLLTHCGERGLFRVVALHHPPLPRQIKWRKALRDAGPLADVLGGCGAELVLHGHSHSGDRRRLASVGRQIPVLGVPSGSALGCHGEVAGYNLFCLRRDSDSWVLDIEHRRFDPARGGFFPDGGEKLRLSAV